MKVRNHCITRSAVVGPLVLLFLAAAVFAGPTLICHQFDIGNAKSLPWSSHDWNLSGGESYDAQHLAADTITILEGNPTVLVHMETLRRATLFARKDPRAAKEQHRRLVARADSAARSKDDYAFDAVEDEFDAEA